MGIISKSFAFFLVFLFTLLLILIVVQTVKAQDTSYPDVFPFNGINIVSPTNGSTYSDSSLILKVNATAQADITLSHTPLNHAQISANYSLDGVFNDSIPMDIQFPQFGIALFTGSVNLPALSQGSHTLTVFSKSQETDVNIAGFYYPSYSVLDRSIINFTVNLGIPPAISNISIENRTYLTNNLTLNFTTNEPISWIGYNLDNQANVTLAGNKSLTALSNGPHYITIYANDTFGNMGNTTINFNIVKPEAFPIATVVVFSVVVAVVSASVILYFRRRKS